MNSSSHLQIPNGFANLEQDIGYIVGPQGFIYCLDLASGETQAISEIPATPLMIDQDTLIGWASESSDPKTIKLFGANRKGDDLRVTWEKPLELPDWVEVDSPEADSLSIVAQVEGDKSVITWEAHSRYKGGAPPPAYVERAAIQDVRHEIQLDPETGDEISSTQMEIASSSVETLPQVGPTRRIVPYQIGNKWETQPWRSGSASQWLVRGIDYPGIILVRQEDGADEALEIRLTKDPDAVASVTPDGNYIFVQEPGGKAPMWLVFSATGERVAQLPYEAGVESVSVVNGRALYVVTEMDERIRRRTLHCRDLQTAEALWSFKLSEERPKAPPTLRPRM